MVWQHVVRPFNNGSVVRKTNLLFRNKNCINLYMQIFEKQMNEDHCQKFPK